MRKNDALTLRPFHYVTPSISTMTIITLCVLCPHVIMLFATASFQSLLVVLSCVLSSLAAEALDGLAIRRRAPNVPVALLQGVLTGMFLPSSYPAVTALLLTFITLFIAKYSFGGIAGSWVNPVAVSIVMAYFIGSIWFPSYIIPPLYLQSGNASLMMISDGVFPVHSFDAAMTGLLNDAVFSRVGTNIPDGYLSLLWDNGAAVPAFRFNLLTLAGSLVLFSTRSLTWEVPASFLAAYSLLVWLLCPVFAGGSPGNGDIILALCTGGILPAAFFVLSWYGTVPMTLAGKLCYGGSTGVAAFLICGYGLSAAGAMFSVFCGNILSLLIQMAEDHCRERRLSRPARPQAGHAQEHS